MPSESEDKHLRELAEGIVAEAQERASEHSRFAKKAIPILVGLLILMFFWGIRKDGQYQQMMEVLTEENAVLQKANQRREDLLEEIRYLAESSDEDYGSLLGTLEEIRNIAASRERP